MIKLFRDLNNRLIFYGTTYHRSYSKMLHSAEKDRPVEYSISSKLNSKLNPEHLQVINESYMHNVPKGSETHFKVVIVSKDFVDMPLIKRHRLIYDLLEDECKSGVHALSIVAKTPDQWKSCDQTVLPSPACRGGFGK